MEDEKRLIDQQKIMMENIRLKEEKNKIEHDKIMKSYEETMKQNAIIHEKNMKNLQVHYDNEMMKIQKIKEENDKRNELEKKNAYEAHLRDLNYIKMNYNKDINMMNEMFQNRMNYIQNVHENNMNEIRNNNF